VTFSPRTLNRRSQGQYIQARINLGPYHTPFEIDPEVAIQLAIDKGLWIVDADRTIDGAEMVVKFSREDAQEAAPLGEAVEFVVTGIVRYEWDFSCSFTGTDYLRVIEEGNVHTNEEDWSSIQADAPRGDLANVRANGNGDMGPGTCLENFQSNYDFGVNPDPDVPPPGKAFIYLYKFCNGTPNCSYGENSNGQELHFSEGGCP